MDEWESIIGGHSGQDTDINMTVPSASSQPSQWCSSCQSLANESEEKFLANFISVKQKIFFTDNLIKMHQDTKRQLEEMTKKYTQAVKSKNLIQSQLQLVLSKDQPSFSDGQKLQSRNMELERMAEDLRAQLMAMDESRKLHEDTIKVLRAEDTANILELKKKHSQQTAEIRKELAEKNEENKKLVKKNKGLITRIDTLRKRKHVSSLPEITEDCDIRQNPTKVQWLSNKSNPNHNPSATSITMEQIRKEARNEQSNGKSSELEQESIKSAEAPSTSQSEGKQEGSNKSDNEIQFVTIKPGEISPMSKPLSAIDKMELENKDHIYQFEREPTPTQLKELSAIAHKFKAMFSKKRPPRKKESLDFLFQKIASFCSQHSLEPRDDIVVIKIYELHETLLSQNRRSLKRFQDALAMVKESRDDTIPVGVDEKKGKNSFSLSISSDEKDSADSNESEESAKPQDDSSISGGVTTAVVHGTTEVNPQGSIPTDHDLQKKTFKSVLPDIGNSVDNISTHCESEGMTELHKSSSFSNSTFISVMPDICDNMESSEEKDCETSNRLHHDEEFVSVMPDLGSSVSVTKSADNLSQKDMQDSHQGTIVVSGSTSSSDRSVSDDNSMQPACDITTLKRKLKEPATPKRDKRCKINSESSNITPRRIRTRSMTASSSSEMDDAPVLQQRKQRTSRVKASHSASISKLNACASGTESSEKQNKQVCNNTVLKSKYREAKNDSSEMSTQRPDVLVQPDSNRTTAVSSLFQSDSDETGINSSVSSSNSESAMTKKRNSFDGMSAIEPSIVDQPEAGERTMESSGLFLSGDDSSVDGSNPLSNPDQTETEIDASSDEKSSNDFGRVGQTETIKGSVKTSNVSLSESDESSNDNNIPLSSSEKITETVTCSGKFSTPGADVVDQSDGIAKLTEPSRMFSSDIDERSSEMNITTSTEISAPAPSLIDHSEYVEETTKMSGLLSSDSDEGSADAHMDTCLNIPLSSSLHNSEAGILQKPGDKKRIGASNNEEAEEKLADAHVGNSVSRVSTHVKMPVHAPLNPPLRHPRSAAPSKPVASERVHGHNKSDLEKEPISLSLATKTVLPKRNRPSIADQKSLNKLIRKPVFSLCKTKMGKSSRTAAMPGKLSKGNRGKVFEHPTPESKSRTGITESDSSPDIDKIFSEMIFNLDPLSPLKILSPAKEKSMTDDSALPTIGQTDENLQDAADDLKHIDNEDAKSKNLILPSMDLCTAINFNTPNKEKINYEDSIPMAVESTEATKTKKNPPIGKLQKDNLSKTVSKEAKESFRPRRFSCEAPVRAVNVPPIKPLSSGPLYDIKLPSMAKCDSDSGKSFPQYRKETDIPSHWHANVTLRDIRLSESDKLKNATPTQPLSLSREMTGGGESETSDKTLSQSNASENLTENVEKTSEKTDLMKQEQIRSEGLRAVNLKALDDTIVMSSDSDISDVKTSENDSNINADCVTVVKNIYPSSTEVDAELVMDIADDAVVEDCYVSLNDVVPDTSNIRVPISETPRDQSISVEKYISDAFDSEPPAVLKRFQDLSGLMAKKGTMKKLAVIHKSFVMNGIISILKSTKDVVNILREQAESEHSVAIHHLPLCEQKFLRRIRVLQLCGAIEKNAVVSTVIPYFMKLLKKINSHPPSTVKREFHWDDPELVQLRPYLYPNGNLINAAGICGLLRVFFFLCKMARVSSPIFSLCRFHILHKRSAYLVSTIVEGLICWPEVLLFRENFGKLFLNALFNDCTAATVVGDKAKRILLSEKIKWTYRKLRWQQSPNVKSLHDNALNNVMSSINSAKFSPELSAFMNEDDSENDHSLASFHEMLYSEIYAMEMFPKGLVMHQVTSEVLYGQFWPLLQTWSCHLHFHGVVDENREVSDDSVTAILESFAHMLSYYLLKQRQLHKEQRTLPQFQGHFETICQLLDNLSTQYKDRSPKIVRCHVAAFLIRTCFCNPIQAHAALLTWAKAFLEQGDSHGSQLTNADINLTTALVGKCVIRRICEWLDRSCPSLPKESLVDLLWPE